MNGQQHIYCKLQATLDDDDTIIVQNFFTSQNILSQPTLNEIISFYKHMQRFKKNYTPVTGKKLPGKEHINFLLVLSRPEE